MYKFPIIEHINQVKEAIYGREEFIVAERDHYDVVNYVVRKETTFPPVIDENTAILRECRGLIFDKAGKIISRPFHKFFNVGEREETQPHLIDLSKTHVIQHKLDGSMIRPLFLEGKIRWATKMGLTDVSLLAESFIGTCPTKYNSFAEYCIMNSVTPIFEFCSRRNRIVIDYPEENLILLAIRHNITGEYLTMDFIAKSYNIPIVQKIEVKDNFFNYVKGLTGIEGFVISFEDGFKVKIKTEEYILQHKTKDSINLEKNVISAIVNDQIDDILGLLPKGDADRLHKFNLQFWENISKTEKELLSSYDSLYKGDRKAFALDVGNKTSPLYKSILFSMIDGKKPLECIVSVIKKNCSSSTTIDKVRPLWGNTKWVNCNVEA